MGQGKIGAARQRKKAVRTFKLTPEQEAMVDRAMAYQPPPLFLERLQYEVAPLGQFGGRSAYYKAKRQWTGPLRMTEETTKRCFEELKRFLVTKVLHPELRLAPSSLIDEAWHLFIIFTEDYFAFCELVGGYIHHRPLTQAELKGVTPDYEVYRLVRAVFPESIGYFWETNYERERSFENEMARPKCCG
jgi:hypothetical protein